MFFAVYARSLCYLGAHDIFSIKKIVATRNFKW
jgi:hypothetical protein